MERNARNKKQNYECRKFSVLRNTVVDNKKKSIKDLGSILTEENLRKRLLLNRTSLATDLKHLIKTDGHLKTFVQTILKVVSNSSNDFVLMNLATLCKSCNLVTSASVDGENGKDRLNDLLPREIYRTFTKLVKLKDRINWIARTYKGPVEKREKWVNNKYEEHFPALQHTVNRYVKFFHCLFLEQVITFTYVMSILTKLSKVERNRTSFELLNELLKHFQSHLKRNVSGNQAWMKGKEHPQIILQDLAKNVNLLAESREILQATVNCNDNSSEVKQYDHRYGMVCKVAPPKSVEVKQCDHRYGMVCEVTPPNSVEVKQYDHRYGMVCEVTTPNSVEVKQYDHRYGMVCEVAPPNSIEVKQYDHRYGMVCEVTPPNSVEVKQYDHRYGMVCEVTPPNSVEVKQYDHRYGMVCEVTPPNSVEVKQYDHRYGMVCEVTTPNSVEVKQYDHRYGMVYEVTTPLRRTIKPLVTTNL